MNLNAYFSWLNDGINDHSFSNQLNESGIKWNEKGLKFAGKTYICRHPYTRPWGFVCLLLVFVFFLLLFTLSRQKTNKQYLPLMVVSQSSPSYHQLYKEKRQNDTDRLNTNYNTKLLHKIILPSLLMRTYIIYFAVLHFTIMKLKHAVKWYTILHQ